MTKRTWWQKLGPGVITGASDDDPSGIVTYTQAGAKFGYGLLWLSVVTTPMMMAVQEMCARLGLVTDRGLAALLKQHVSRRIAIVLSFIVLIVNTFNIGADIGAMAEVTKLIIPGPAVLYLLAYVILMVALEVTLPYRKYVRVLKWLTLALVTYAIAALVATKDWAAVFSGLVVPHFSGGAELWLMVVAVLGTTISPYLFFWQASEEVEERDGWSQSDQISPAVMTEQLKIMRRDTAVGMVFSNLIMFFIIVTAAGTLHQSGTLEVTTAAQAATTLQPVAGQLTSMLFSLGILGTGLLAIPILAGSAGYAMAEAFGWKEGLNKKLRQAKKFYFVIIGAIAAGMLTHWLGISPIRLLVYAAVLNGLAAPLLLWFIIRLADRESVVGTHTSPPVVRRVGWVTFGAMSLAALVVLWGWITG